MSLVEWLEVFPWESDDQRKGLLALVQWFNRIPKTLRETPEFEFLCVSAFFIQKDHESHVWWVDTMATHFAVLQNEVKILQDKVRYLETQADRDLIR